MPSSGLYKVLGEITSVHIENSKVTSRPLCEDTKYHGFETWWLLQFQWTHKSQVSLDDSFLPPPPCRFHTLNLCSETNPSTSTGAACCSVLPSRGRLPPCRSCWLCWRVLRPSILTSQATWARISTCRSVMPSNCHWCHLKITSLLCTSIDFPPQSTGGVMVQWRRRGRPGRLIGNAV